MIRAIRIRGLGPHVDTRLDLDPKGVTVLEGPSEAGKSTIADAVCFALWGWGRDGRPLDVSAIRDAARPGEDAEARVDLTLMSGATLTRIIRRTADGKRSEPIRTWTAADGTSQPYPTEKAWAARLATGKGPHSLASAELIRLVIVPMAWRELALGEGHGRPLRDALVKILPDAASLRVPVIEWLMEGKGYQMRPGDPVNERDAVALRSHALSQRDQAEGARKTLLAQVERELKAEPVVAPSLEQIAGAQDVLHREHAWSLVADPIARAQTRGEEIARATERAAAWDARRAELGERPAEGTDARALKQERYDLEHRLSRVRQLVAEHRVKVAAKRDRVASPYATPAQQRAYNDACRAAADAQAALASASDVCPTCARPGWTEAVRILEERVASTLAAKAEATAIYEAEVAEFKAAAESDLERLTAELAEHEADETAAIARIEVLTSQIAEATAGSAAATTWDGRLRALGAKPEIPNPLVAPPAPSFARPSQEQVRAAQAVIQRRDEAAGAGEQREAHLRDLEAQAGRAEESRDTWDAERTRLDALVESIRLEPSESVRRQLATLGDLGPVEVRLRGEKGGVDVLVDGRPWSLASDGRQVVADVWLRAGIRRALGLAWVPLLIDRAQDVGGQDLPAPAPAVVLYTVHDGALRVAAAERAA